MKAFVRVFVKLAVVALMALLPGLATAGVDSCSTCAFPCAPSAATTLELIPRAGRSVPRQAFVSIVRDTIGGLSVRQALRCRWVDHGVCRDTLVPLSDVDGVNMAGSLGKVPPVMARVLPARVFERSTIPSIPQNWLEVAGYIAYGGKDESAPNTTPVGFNSVLYGGEFLINPIGHLYGENLDLAVGGGLMSESGRLRFDVMGHLRWSFGGFRRRSRTSFQPSACTFTCNPAATDTATPGRQYTEIPIDGASDPAVYMTRDIVVERNGFRPFLFAEGGVLVPGDFDGAGPDPSVNADEYGEYFLGAGVGLPIADVLSVSLAYRYWRLNVRTPCPTCNDVDIVNTNVAHTILLKLAYHLDW